MELKFKETFKKNAVLIFIIAISIISALRSLVVPIHIDELTYLKLSENLLMGKYFLSNNPSPVSPVIPLFFALFKTKTYPIIGFVLHKLFNIILASLGFRYAYLILKEQNLDKRVVLAIITLAIVNPTSVAWFSTLYPEAILFFSFWGFIYYSTKEFSESNLIKMLLFFTLMCFTRYVYAVLGVVIIIKYYEVLKSDFKSHALILFKYSILFVIPVIIWGKYLINVESNEVSGLSYFNRFKVESPLLYNIKCGLGLEKHHLVDKINGVPAFISLFVPKTGFRSYVLSILLLFIFSFGYLKFAKTKEIKLLFFSCVFVMLGFILAGTGFSRYWLTLLPIYILGFYYFLKYVGVKDKQFILLSIIVSLVYIINELRLDYLILNKYL